MKQINYITCGDDYYSATAVGATDGISNELFLETFKNNARHSEEQIVPGFEILGYVCRNIKTVIDVDDDDAEKTIYIFTSR
jgi:hypothetical protein